MNQVLDKEQFFWLRMMKKYNENFKEFQISWQRVISKTSADIVKKLTLAIYKFFKKRSTRVEKQWHPLFIAAEQNSLQLCEHIFKKTGEKNPTRNEDCYMPIHMAAQEGHLLIYQLLVQNVENKNPSEKEGWTPIHWAAQEGHLEMIRYVAETVVEFHGMSDKVHYMFII